MARRAHVVKEARKRELGGAHTAADRAARFEHDDRTAAPRELDGGNEAVRTRSDDDGVGHLGA